MDRPAIAERFFAKALGLLQLGVSEAFSRRWGETMHKVRIHQMLRLFRYLLDNITMIW